MPPKAKGDSESKNGTTLIGSYAERLKSHVSFSQRLNRNILEISLEKSNRQSLSQDLSSESIANVFKSLGIDIVTQLEGYQIQNKGFNSAISVWFKEGVNIEKFCKDVSIRVNDEVRTGIFFLMVSQRSQLLSLA